MMPAPSPALHLEPHELEALKWLDALLSADPGDPANRQKLAEVDPILGKIFDRAFAAAVPPPRTLSASTPLTRSEVERLRHLDRRISGDPLGRDWSRRLTLQVAATDGEAKALSRFLPGTPEWDRVSERIASAHPVLGGLFARAFGAAVMAAKGGVSC
jgi:hypothetical protein